MIQFSSNANTDYLIEILGLDNINQVPERLGIEDHDPLFPVVSSMYIPVQLMQDKNLTPQTLVITMDKLSDEEYRDRKEHTSELQSRGHLVCRLQLEKKKI